MYAIIGVYRKEDRIEQKVKGEQRKKKLSKMHVDTIRMWIDDDCIITLKAMKARVYDKFGVTVCEKTVDNCISPFCHTLKRATVIPVRWNDKRILEAWYD